jgi:hypothetical protein
MQRVVLTFSLILFALTPPPGAPVKCRPSRRVAGRTAHPRLISTTDGRLFAFDTRTNKRHLSQTG